MGFAMSLLLTPADSLVLIIWAIGQAKAQIHTYTVEFVRGRYQFIFFQYQERRRYTVIPSGMRHHIASFHPLLPVAHSLILLSTMQKASRYKDDYKSHYPSYTCDFLRRCSDRSCFVPRRR